MIMQKKSKNSPKCTLFKKKLIINYKMHVINQGLKINKTQKIMTN